MSRYQAIIDEFSLYVTGACLCGVPKDAAVVPVTLFLEVLIGASTLEEVDDKFRLLFHIFAQEEFPPGIERYAYSRLIALCRARTRQLVN